MKKEELSIEYYAIENTVNEYHTAVTGKYKTLEDAKNDLCNHSDWYCSKGTGRIYKVKQWFEGYELKEEKKLMYQRAQSDLV